MSTLEVKTCRQLFQHSYGFSHADGDSGQTFVVLKHWLRRSKKYLVLPDPFNFNSAPLQWFAATHHV